MNNESRVWIALLRGINVGGHRKLPMAELRKLFADAGCTDTRTYIQSGNVAFRTAGAEREQLATRLADQIEEAKGFRPTIMLLTRDELDAAAEANPFPEAASEPKALHVWFLAHEPADTDFYTLDQLRAPTEQYKLHGTVFYLWAPDGIGRSKLAGRVERSVGVGATARNWRTVEKLREIASGVASSPQ